MPNYPTSSLIIATYNWPEALELVLLSVKKQSVLPNEVIIADDGSADKTRILIENFQKTFIVPLIHVWHKDDGFRLAQIRNKAICKANFEYIIQIDGDTILHKHFIKNHLQIAEKGCYLTASRVLLNEEATIYRQIKKDVEFSWLSKKIKNRINAMYIPFLSPFLTNPTQSIDKAERKVRGCNMSFWRNDLVEINGYNEDMIGWGREDSELSVRLVNSGKIKKRIKFGAIQYHQYHKENSKKGLNKNDEILKIAIQEKRVRCKNGVSNHCQ